MDLKVSSAKYRSFRLNVLRVQSSVILFLISLGASQKQQNSSMVSGKNTNKTKQNKPTKSIRFTSSYIIFYI